VGELYFEDGVEDLVWKDRVVVVEVAVKGCLFMYVESLQIVQVWVFL
jgi:hypothetical protein